MNTRWRNEWTDEEGRERSQLGFELERQDGELVLFRAREGKREGIGTYSSIEEAKDAADQLLLNELRIEAGTGLADHVVVEGIGGLWDCTVAEHLAALRWPARFATLHPVAEAVPPPRGHVVCVPIEVVLPRRAFYQPHILLGRAEAERQIRKRGTFLAVLLLCEEAEIARVPDAGDTAEARTFVREMKEMIRSTPQVLKDEPRAFGPRHLEVLKGGKP